jgi:ubiquinone/menaquinone biosynthesis C-methylase UbiE
MKLENLLDDWYHGRTNSGIGYEEFYYSGLIGAVSKVMHRCIELDFKENDDFPITLELGAGHNQHFKFVKHSYDVYIASDLRISNLKKNRIRSSKLKYRKIDACNLSAIKDESVNRIIATCLLAHLSNPKSALQAWKNVISKSNGVITIYVPTEGGIMTQMARRIFIWPKSSKILGADPELICYEEHINSYIRMNKLIRSVFNDAQIKTIRFPFLKLYWQFSLFEVYQIKYSK